MGGTRLGKLAIDTASNMAMASLNGNFSCLITASKV